MSTPAGRHPFFILAIVLTAVFVQLLDISIVNVAIPSIQADVGASFAAVQLVLAGYQLAFACVLITGARLGDIFGRRRLFLVGMAVFTVASTLCGLAPNATTLVSARVLQGLGSGLMFPQVLAVIQVTIPPRERGRAFGFFGATIGLATILGPLMGGLLIKANLFGTDWRAIFLVNIPIGLLALVAAMRALPESTSPDAPRLDVAGAALVTTGLFLLIFPLTEGREKGWPAWIFLMLFASVPVLAAFVVLQRRKTARAADPLLLMTLFANRSFRAGLVLSGVFFLGIAPFFFVFSLYLQLGLGYAPLHSGLTTLPFAVGSALASSRSDLLTRRLGSRVLALGSGLLTLGMGGVVTVLHLAGNDLRYWQIGPVLFVCGLGLGCFVAPLTNLVLTGITGREAGSASGVLSTGQQIAGALGVAVVGLVLFGQLSSGASAAADRQAFGLPAQLKAAGLPPAASGAVTARFTDCYVRRARGTDPSAVPAGCAVPPGQERIGAVLGRAARRANADNFLHATERTLLLEILVFGAAFVAVRFLPAVPAAATTGAAAGAAGGAAA